MAADHLTGKYIVLTTFRRDGTPVPTTVWFAHRDDGIVIPTGSKTGKVKRIRNRPDVTMVRSNIRGRPKGGPTVTGKARILGDDEAQVARYALASKYGLVWRVTSRNADMILHIAADEDVPS